MICEKQLVFRLSLISFSICQKRLLINDLILHILGESLNLSCKVSSLIDTLFVQGSPEVSISSSSILLLPKLQLIDLCNHLLLLLLFLHHVVVLVLDLDKLIDPLHLNVVII